jgi:leukotriene-A4 hydrolase
LQKGANFLYYLEKVVGGLQVFNRKSLAVSLPPNNSRLTSELRAAYHKAFVNKFSGYSISTEDWLDHFWFVRTSL